jgi:cardiolipin synthase (CMP-forming)
MRRRAAGTAGSPRAGERGAHGPLPDSCWAYNAAYVALALTGPRECRGVGDYLQTWSVLEFLPQMLGLVALPLLGLSLVAAHQLVHPARQVFSLAAVVAGAAFLTVVWVGYLVQVAWLLPALQAGWAGGVELLAWRSMGSPGWAVNVAGWTLSGAMGWALAGFVIAGVSDGIDGFIARQFNQRSALGAYLDPMADKLLLVSVFIVLGLMGELPIWLVLAAVSRDALIVTAVLISTIMANPVEMKPLFVSKANTAVQIVLAAVVLSELAFAQSFWDVRTWLIVISGLLTAASAAAYLVAWLRHMNGYGESETPRS